MPGVGPFHYPSRGKRGKTGSAFRALLHFDPPAGPMRFEPRLQVMIVILAIAKDDREPREIFHTDLGEEFDRGGPIIQCGARDQNDE